LLALLLASCCRIGVATGLQARDVELSVVRASSEMPLPDEKMETVEHDALKIV